MIDNDCGCNVREYATADVPEIDPRGDQLTRWSGLIAPYGVPTGDKRQFAAGSLDHRPLPQALKWQRVDDKGHSHSVAVGTVEGVEYGEDGVRAWGILLDPDPAQMPRLAEDVAEAKLLMEKRIIGPSVDLSRMNFRQLDAAEFADLGENAPEIEVTSGEFAAVTMVMIPAFVEARPFALDKISVSDYESLTASARADVPVRRNWDDVAVAWIDWDAEQWLSQEAEDGALVASCSLYEDAELDLFPVAQRIGNEVFLVPGAVADAVSVFSLYEDQLPIGSEAREVMKTTLAQLSERCELPPPPWLADEPSLVASGAPVAPPRGWFETQEADRPTPLTITDDGRVFGHIADWRTCHTGIPGQCVNAPRSASAYAYAHTGAVKTAEGEQLAVGRLTVGGGHASTRPGVGFRAAIEHYDNASTTAAIGRFQDGKHGIWFSGAVVPEATEQQIAQLRRHPPSGDWRTIGGTKEMILAHSVNAPGFPVISAGVERGEMVSLVAAGALLGDDEPEDGTEAPSGADERQEAALAVFTARQNGKRTAAAVAAFASRR